ncbi:FliM/FliN family flagellar motor switch protein [Pseudomonas mucidolens]|uniref:Type III secretion protein Q n=1 Tax=Pseudomonas mucidolens TaxID=46679 RepID=A0A1H2NGV7_9PSED|nr:FliM/FliN family flagellar motor switch protein [Pseudomonas mucidolens]SDV04682.1 type III secretion protein Q [Pseudomonas mucidolens]SQH31947.1 putative type III secretion protein [Pseudomonas mucidolens]
MMLPALKLPVVDGTKVLARRRLGRGLRLPFEVAGQSGELLLEPGIAPAGKRLMSFETARGVLTFSEPGAVLSLFGECPVGLAEAGNDPASWVWAVFQQSLSPQLNDLFGYLQPLGQLHRQTFGCRFTVALGASRVVARLMLAPASLLALCDAAPWRPMAKALPGSLALSLPVTLARLQLTASLLQALRPGDVLVLESPLFNTQGDGCVRLGKHLLQGCLDDQTGALQLTLFSMRETAVDENFAEQSHEQGWDGQAEYESGEPLEDVFGHEPFDELSMALTVRCGTLQLTLGELRQLAPGAVLGICGYGPGLAGLYYGERPIGQGQLVEVDGRLGLQLSRVIFSR